MSDATSSGASPSVSVPSSLPETSAPTTAAETPQQKSLRFKAKVEGSDEDVELDEETIKRDYQKWSGADARFREAAKLMKEAGATKAEIEAFKKNPIKALEDAGANAAQIRAFAEEYLLKHLEEEQLDPAERRARQAEAKAKKLEDDLKKAKESESAQKRSAAEAKAVEEIDTEIGAALKAMGRRPTPRLIARVAESLIADFEAKQAQLQAEYGDEIPDEAFERVPRLPAADAVKRVQQEYMQDISEFLGSLPIDEVRKFLPREILDGLRQAELSAVLSQDPVGSRKPRTQEPAPEKRKEKLKRMSSNEFFKNMDKKWGT